MTPAITAPTRQLIAARRLAQIALRKPTRSKVELENFDVAKSEVVLDVSELLRKSDLSTTVECHSGAPNCEPMFKALGVDHASGKPTSKASAFRLK